MMRTLGGLVGNSRNLICVLVFYSFIFIMFIDSYYVIIVHLLSAIYRHSYYRLFVWGQIWSTLPGVTAFWIT